MVLWTIQTETAWEALRRRGVLIGALHRIAEASWIPAYQWMARQMRARLHPPPHQNALPVWAWRQWEGVKRKRPDLRAGGHLPRNEKGVRIEFECPDSSALLSDFELWHYVLNYWYLPESEADGDAFEHELKKWNLSFFRQKPLPHAECHKKIVNSWNRIFDIDWTEPDLAAPQDEKSIQAVVWQLKLDQVRRCDRFTAR